MADSPFVFLKKQSGFTYIRLVVGLASTTIAGAAIVGSLANFLKGHSALEKRVRASQQVNAIAVAIRNALVDIDADNVGEAPAYTVLGTKPTDGGNLPRNLGLALSDPWGTYYGYCSWDNGSINSSVNRNSGDNPESQNSALFAILSAGPDGVFSTTCAQVKAGVTNGDDLSRLHLQAASTSGTAGALYFGEPVANVATLNTAALRKGEIRLETSSGNVKSWDGAAWQTVVGQVAVTGTWQGSVLNIADLPDPPIGEFDGTVIWVTAENKPYIWTEWLGWNAVNDPSWTGVGNNVNRTLWTWGANYYGSLGNNSGTTTFSNPITQLGALSNWKQILGGNFFTTGIKTDGSLWTWGLNSSGQLGLGDVANRSSPVQVGTLTNWQFIAGKYYHTLAKKTDGSLWTWGLNNYGQLGLNDIANRSSPVQIGALSSWKTIDASGSFSLAVKTDGSLWSWGQNVFGNLGLNDVTNRSSPVQIGALTNWKSINLGDNHVVAIKTDGSLWSWGQNTAGQLGLMDILPRSSPVQVGLLTNWKKISARTRVNAAIKTDGSLWTWGFNGYGQLGLNDIANRSSPVQVGVNTNWKQSSLQNTIMAIKTDGTLWGWGWNNNGQLGDGTIVSKSSPVQTGTLTNWKFINAGASNFMGIKN